MAFGMFVKTVAITDFKIHQNSFKCWFTLLHFVMDDPVLALTKESKKIELRGRKCYLRYIK